MRARWRSPIGFAITRSCVPSSKLVWSCTSGRLPAAPPSVSSTCTIVIPCYNEAARLDHPAFSRFVLANKDVDFLFVDDGSTDSTRQTLESLRESRPDQFRVLGLERNFGKAEAVRHGLLAACERKPDYVGFWDADLATPL